MASLMSRFFRMVLKSWAIREFDTTATVEQQRAVVEKFANRMPFPHQIQIEDLIIGNMHAEWLRVPDCLQDQVIFYLHGGAYYLGSCSSSRGLAARLALAAGANAFLIDYRRAPEHKFPAALEDVKLAYSWLLGQGISSSQIVIVGESAGGGLALATLLALLDEQAALPAAAVCISPWIDLTNTGESYLTRVDVDPWQTTREDHHRSARMYIEENDPRNPLISPLYGDMQGLPQLLIHVGDHEVLLSDSTRLAERARTDGVDVTLRVWDRMWHVFHSLGEWMPESRRAIQEIGVFIRDS
jgi:acetyl esterase/lipase